MMQRVRAVIEKMQLLAERKADRTVIDIDLMLDYTRVLYADLLEIRNSMAARNELHINEPTLDELTAAMEAEEADNEDMPMALPETPLKQSSLFVPEAPPTPQPIATPEKEPEPEIEMPAMATTTLKPPTTVRDIRQLIDLNEKYLLLSELFRNDTAAYETAMKQLSASGSEEAAVEWINGQTWPEQSEAAAMLRQTIRRLYA